MTDDEPKTIFTKVNGVATPNLLRPTAKSIVTNPEVETRAQNKDDSAEIMTDQSEIKKPNNLHRKQIISKKSPTSKHLIEKKRCNIS